MLTSVPGIGFVLAAGIAGELGGPARLASPRPARLPLRLRRNRPAHLPEQRPTSPAVHDCMPGILIRIQLICEADPAFYDLPLTLETRVFADWKQCVVRQGDRTLTVPVRDGMARYPARPGKEAIHLSKP